MNNASEPIWLLEPNIHYLNHGSFGATPIAVLNYQQSLRERMEREPVRFLTRELEGLLDEARSQLADFIGTDADDIAFIPNATVGVNTILRSLAFKPDDEILITDRTYNACRNAAEFVAHSTGAKIVVASVPFPLESSQQVVTAILEKVSPKTKLALLDHVTSPTASIFPIETLVKELARRGIDTLVDGAHAPGFVSLDLRSLDVTYYTGNCHKWLCAPKGAAFLYVRKDKQASIRPLAISHGSNSPRTDRSRFRLEFDWTGTDDPTAYLCVPEAIRVMGSLLPGGWSSLRERNRKLVLAARQILCKTLEVAIPCPDEMLGSMASVPLGTVPLSWESLQSKLLEEFKIEVPIVPLSDGSCLVRISAQFYNRLDQYQYLAEVLKRLLG
ncbi:MAG: aminotransferase class V-fold PLP-dependent enzyme [Hydrococcus sp. C42_A2020_068]|uniref:aminotransferase class V-fold PLP-dependent enzyme n=1 Tax=Pleurocapsa sp. PCC 7327 TaxID=118163 RepID=UPI00029F955D|nr:aminotransferase class V-fold PLP-dependent enzyme [Pleurocapsa sp. PCC 7327]AFY79399.1 selenocysteine lyase [Pleurocapsa sp. PCC 7327]MBF2020104.1 aminotransferase class V-fold PLP-dependent enzyme [Hydrococcus sp. C42_A2020_068]